MDVEAGASNRHLAHTRENCEHRQVTSEVDNSIARKTSNTTAFCCLPAQVQDVFSRMSPSQSNKLKQSNGSGKFKEIGWPCNRCFLCFSSALVSEVHVQSPRAINTRPHLNSHHTHSFSASRFVAERMERENGGGEKNYGNEPLGERRRGIDFGVSLHSPFRLSVHLLRHRRRRWKKVRADEE